MSLGNGNAKASNKGSNYSYELKTLKVLNAIKDGIGGGGGGATEATLQALLAAVEASRDYEVRIVNDSNPGGEVTFLEVRYWDAQDGTLGSPVYYLPGSDTPYNIGDPGGPVAPLSYVPTSTLLTQILGELTSINTNVATETTLGDVLAELQGTLNVSTEVELAKDFFKNLITVTPYNQIELRLDKASYTDFVTENTFNTGAITQTGGLLFLNTGVDAAGKSTIESLDSIEYRPGAEIFAGGTATFTAPAANNIRRIGLVDDIDTFNNSLTFGYEGTAFSIRYTSGGAVQLNVAQASWDDPCDGTAGSKFTLGGTPVALDHTKGNIYRFRAGLFGFAGWTAEILSPDGDWVEVYRYKHNNAVATPVFTSNTLNVVLYNENTGNTTDLEISAQCWNGGGTSQFDRINSTLTDRTLAQTVRSVITGVTTGGGGGYVNVKVNPSGALTVEATIDPISVTPNIIRATGAGTIPAGARSFSIANVGAADGDILGGTNNIKAGEILNFDAGLNNVYGAVAYDATGTELLITYNS